MNLRILHLEDSPRDAELIQSKMESGGLFCDVLRVETEGQFSAALTAEVFDVILCDYNLPGYDGLDALTRAQELQPGTPVLLISGTLGEDQAVQCLQLGATDYLVKQRLDRLASAVKRALMEAANRQHRRQAERALAASERRLRTIFETEPECVKLFGPDGVVLEMNPAGLRMVEADSPDQVLGRSMFDLVRPADRAAFTALSERVLRGESGTLEFEIQGLKGTRRWLATHAVPLRDEAGQVQSALAISRDITERKQAEARLKDSERLYQSLVETLPQHLFRKDGEGRFTFANGAFCQLVGRELKEILGRTDADFFPPAQVAAYRADDLQVMTRGKVLHRVEEQRAADGKTLFMQVVKAPLRDAQGAVCGVQGIFWDVTQERRLTAQLREAQKMEAIGQLAGGIAHDFNNILAAILGNVELARSMRPEDPGVPECLNAIFLASRRAADLVKQILAFSRRQEQTRLPIQLQIVVREALKLLRATVPASIEFKTNLAPTRTVLADASQVHQVVMNLCTNAAHAMRDRPGVLQVELAEQEVDAAFVQAHPDLAPGAHVCLSVTDTGSGMDSATLGRIFEPFFTTKPVGEGTGLGLSVVHGIVQNHDGTLLVESKPGVGTTFRVYFPVFETPVLEHAAVAAPLSGGHGERILFVDDEETLVRLAQTILERFGYRVTPFTSVTEALAHFRAQPDQFDLVITDLNMPGMNGSSFARELLALRPKLKMILTTGYSAMLTPEQVREMGFRALLPKPTELRAVGELVQRVLAEANAA